MKLSNITKWVSRRASERSTYTGLAAIAGLLGAKSLGVQINELGTAIPLILGGIAVGASTKHDEG